jgi:two-component system NtrC family sensor kinase
VTRRWHPLIEAEVRRWLGATPPSDATSSLLDALSVRLEVLDDVRAADSAGELEAFFRLSGDFLLVLDRNLRVRHLNTAFMSWGYSVSSFRGRSFLELVIESERESTRATFVSILKTHEQVPLATRISTASGERRVVHWQISTDGAGERVFLVGRDVTDQERMHDALAQATRMEAVARLASGVAHEVNTPLQYLTDNAAFIDDSLSDLEPIFDSLLHGASPDVLKTQVEMADLPYLRRETNRALDGMRYGLRRVGQLVTSLKELAPSSGSSVELQEVDVLPIVRNALTAQCSHRQGLELELSLEPLPLLECHNAEISRVISALLDNALRALQRKHGDQGGHLKVCTGLDETGAFVQVTDNGPGISESLRTHLFEPFVSTRDVGEGTGQSLAIARSIMERHKGSLSYTSDSGNGTTFTVRLPIPVDESLWS